MLRCELAPLCSSLLAIDVSQVALDQAAWRLINGRHVTFERIEVLHDRIDGELELIAVSEVLYFLSALKIERTSRMLWESMAKDGECLRVNWTGADDLALDGNDAVGVFATSAP